MNTVGLACYFCGRQFGDSDALQNHHEICDFKAVYCDNGCGASIYRCNLINHKNTECTRRYLQCKYCQQECIAISLTDHHYRCPKMMIECPNKCDAVIVQREHLKLHLETVCSVNTTSCDYKYAQCQFKGTKEILEKHLNESYAHHLQLLGAMVVGLNQQLVQTTTRLNQTETKFSKLETKTKSSLKRLQQTIDKLSADTEMKLTILNNDATNRCNRKLESTEEKLTLLHDKLKSIENEKLTEITKESTQIRENLALMNRVLTKNRSGEFVWKITDWAKIMIDTKFGKTNVLYSPEFYTSQYGYKMKLALYPNGEMDRSDNGRHLSVFLKIVPGDYDAILSWPFKLNHSITLMDQRIDKFNAEHITDTTIPTSNPGQVEIWKRPDKNANTGYGFPKFVSHEQLNKGKFIVDDTIFIHFEIDI